MKGEPMKLSAFDVLFLIACGIHVESCDFAEREPVWELDGDAETGRRQPETLNGHSGFNEG